MVVLQLLGNGIIGVSNAPSIGSGRNRTIIIVDNSDYFSVFIDNGDTAATDISVIISIVCKGSKSGAFTPGINTRGGRRT